MWKLVVLLFAFAFAAANANEIPGLKHYHAADAVTRERAFQPAFAAGAKSQLVRLTATGQAQRLDQASTFIRIESGIAILKLGGSLTEPHAIQPGEFAGRKITGGEVREIRPGDIIVIPARLPHQIIVNPGQPVSYEIAKTKVSQ